MTTSPVARALALLLASTSLFVSLPARADAADDAKRHFLNGVHLFEDRNFTGALAEFEASFQAKPTAVALQNIAIAQKGLFRYADAVASLERLLRDFGPSLSAEDKGAAETAIRDMNGLLGAIVVQTDVPGATIAINGTALTPDAAKAPVRLAAGEYRVSAEAAGHERAEKSVTVVSGEKARTVVLTLAPLSGTITVHAKEAQAAIAIDRVPMAWGEWTGTVPAGMHMVYVYKEGFAPYVEPINVIAGQSSVINAALGAPDAGPYTGPYAPPPVYVAKPQRGFYGHATLGVYSMSSAPAGLKRASASAGALGLRGGYRVSNLIGVELMLEGERGQMKNQTCDVGTCSVDYDFATTRIGPNLRVMTGGLSSRGFATVGIGAALHSIDKVKATGNDASRLRLTAGQSYGGASAYLLLEAGWEFQLGHWLLAADLAASLESARGTKNGDGVDPFDDTGAALPQVGLGVRFGYGQW